MFKTNKAGFVEFTNRDWSYKGDKGTWARVLEYEDHRELVVKRAAKGVISSDFEKEMSSFCENYGIDFQNLPCGQTATVKL